MNHKIYAKILIISILTLFSKLYTQQIPPIQSYPMEVYAAGSQNWMVAQGPNREMYFANNEGLLVYDAARWNLYPTSSILRSVAYVDGMLYSGSYMDFGYWEKDAAGVLAYTSLTKLLEFSPLEDEQFWNILSLDDTIIFQSLDRLLLFDKSNNNIKVYQPDSSILKSYVVDDRLLFQQQDKGLFELTSSGIQAFIVSNEFDNSIIVNVFSSGDGYRLLTSNKGFYTYSRGRLQSWPLINNLIGKDVFYSALRTESGNYVIGTISNGVFIVNENQLTVKHMNFQKGLLNNTVLSVFEDMDQNLWLGLDSGINCLNINAPFEEFNDRDDLLGAVYASIRHKDLLYVGTNRGLFVRPANNPDANFIPIEGIAGQVWSLQLVNETLFCGHDSGTYVIDRLNSTQIESLYGSWTHKIIDKHTILVGTYSGLHVIRLVNNQWRYSHKIKGFDISSLHVEITSEKDILVSHEYKGVYRLKVNDNFKEVEEIHKINIKQTRHSSLVRLNEDIYYLCPDGFFRYVTGTNEFRLVSVSTEMFSNDNYVSGKMVVDEQSRIWTFFNKNIVILDKNIFDASFSVQKLPIPYEYRKANLGFENIQLLSNYSYLLGTLKGFLVLHLNEYRTPEANVSLNHIYAKDLNQSVVNLPVSVESSLKPAYNNIGFEFSVPYYGKLNAIEYQWKLEGYHNDWVDWSFDNNTQFNNLNFGSYVFHLKAKSGQQLLGDTIKYPFSIQRPWYVSYTAIGGYFLLLVLISLLINNLYTSFYKKQQTRFIEDTHKELALKELANTKALVEAKNEQLNQRIENKNRELAISTMSMIKKNTLLGSIKEELITIENVSQIKSVIRSIDNNINNEDDWSFFEEAFNNADKDFLKKIKDIHPKLTPNDLRLCAYLRLNLSSKEIASLLNISSKSVDIKRYRLRKRMNLDHQTNLISYILSV